MKTIVKNGKELRFGYTTGSCAAAVSTAATQMLITNEKITQVTITLPNEEKVIFQIHDIEINKEFVKCSVTKDGGDDPDATHGAKIFATVRFLNLSQEGELSEISAERQEGEVVITGGKGVGVVTAKGLQVSVGKPAINPVPTRMIRENTKRILDKFNCKKSVEVEISVPEGEEIAKRTYNPRLGIIGGISILGTTGIVEPMSEKALVDTIKVVIDKKYEEDPDNILIAPGNYGKDFAKEYLKLDIEKAVAVSNYIGEALDYIKYKGFKKILFVGHSGKLIKIAAGIMNTHSSYADGRMEIIGVHSALCGADVKTIEKIMKSITTDEAFYAIKDKEYFEKVKENILGKVMYHLNFRLRNTNQSQIQIEVVMFTTDRDNVIKSKGADGLIKYFQEDMTNEG